MVHNPHGSTKYLREDMKKVVLSIVFLCSFFAFVSCSEDICNHYEKCSKNDFAQNPWLPKFLEKIDCKNISLYHNLDTNEIWGKFYICDDSSFEPDDSNFIMNRKYEKRLNKIGLGKSYSILKTEDNEFYIKLFCSNSDDTLLFFYGKAK